MDSGHHPGDDQAPGRRRCPTCNAPRRDQLERGPRRICHRCKSDLTPLVQLEYRVDTIRAEARRCYARGWYRQAAALAGEILSLEASPDDCKLAACAYLLCGDFPAAWKTYLRTCV